MIHQKYLWKFQEHNDDHEAWLIARQVSRPKSLTITTNRQLDIFRKFSRKISLITKNGWSPDRSHDQDLTITTNQHLENFQHIIGTKSLTMKADRQTGLTTKTLTITIMTRPKIPKFLYFYFIFLSWPKDVFIVWDWHFDN